MTESELLSLRIFLVKVTLKTGQQKKVLMDSVLKTNLWTYEIKDLNTEKIIISFYEKELLRSKL